MIPRPARFESDVPIEGILHLPDGDEPFAGVVVCHPHPLYGGSMHNNVVDAICAGLVAVGIAALRFNFRGVGGSGGEHDNGDGERRDVAAALAYLAAQPEIDGARRGLAGYSFGAMMAEATATDAPIHALALVSPPMRAVQAARLDAFDGALLLVTGDADHVSPAESFRVLVAGLSRPVESHVLAGVDHSWFGHEAELEHIAGPFFAQALAAQEVSA